MRSSGMGISSTSLALLPIAIAINIAVGHIVQVVLKLPIYLDSIGTVLVGVLLGPWVGALTGALTNIIWGATLAPTALPFFYVAAAIGLMAGFAGRLGLFVMPSPRWLSAIIGALFMVSLALFVVFFLNSSWDEAGGYLIIPSSSDMIGQYPILFLIATIIGAAGGYFLFERAGYVGGAGLVTGLVAAILSAPTAAVVFGGVTGSGTDLIVAAFRASGAGIFASTLAQGAVSDPFDKMASYLLVWLILQSLPKRFLSRFPNAARGSEAGRVAEKGLSSR